MIDELPDELIGLIASNLSQSDCYHLMLCNKSLYNASLWRLYDSIIVDSTNQIYHKELVNFNDVIKYQNRKYKSTVIKTCNGLKHFFKTLECNESLVHLINYIKVIKLPDHFIEFELAKHFKFLFDRLSNLKGCDFEYSSCFINLDDLISRLPHHGRLVELTGDFNTTISLKKKKLNGLSSISNVSDHLELQKLSLNNFQFSEYLKDLKLPMTLNKLSLSKNQQNTFPINYSLVNTIGIDFNYLQDCFNKYFYNGMTNELQTDMRAIFNRNHNSNHSMRSGQDIDFNTIKFLFHNTSHRLDLEELRFDGITFSKDDDKVLIKHCNLKKLKKLTILECDDETANSNWLIGITPFIKNLKELNISMENQLQIPNLIYQIDSLDKIYINIRDSEFSNYDYLNIFKSLNKHKKITRLIIDSNSDNQLKSIPIKLLEKKLTRLNKLTKLRITISIKNLARFIYNVLPYLIELQFLELIFEEFNVVNANTSTSAYMINEDPLYDNDNEDYEFNMIELTPSLLTLEKVKKINAQILYNCPSLQYSKIFNVLLTNDNCTKERGLENWFIEKLL